MVFSPPSVLVITVTTSDAEEVALGSTGSDSVGDERDAPFDNVQVDVDLVVVAFSLDEQLVDDALSHVWQDKLGYVGMVACVDNTRLVVALVLLQGYLVALGPNPGISSAVNSMAVACMTDPCP